MFKDSNQTENQINEEVKAAPLNDSGDNLAQQAAAADESANEIDSLAEQINALKEEAASLKKEAEENHNKWLRAEAEMENLRRRLEKEKDEARKYAVKNFALDVVGVLDNLSRAMDSAPNHEDLPQNMRDLFKGVEMTAKEALKIFEKNGITKVPSEKCPFDLNLHQAMFEVETDEHEAGTIVQVFQQGYYLHDRLLRPALVGVAKAKA